MEVGIWREGGLYLFDLRRLLETFNGSGMGGFRTFTITKLSISGYFSS